MNYAIAVGAGAVGGFALCWLLKGEILAELKLAHSKLDTLLARVKAI